MAFLLYNYKQKNDWTCGPAVMRTVLHSFGIQRDINDLVKELGTTRSGTDTKRFLRVLEKEGFRFSVKKKASLAQLQRYLKTHVIIISYWIPSQSVSHYSIVTKITKRRIFFHDTWFGSRHSYALDYFLRNWFDEDYTRWFLAIKK